jgi:tetratricopeptide (TPR) repeat protein
MAVKIEVALMRFRILRGYSTEARKNVRAALVLPGIQEPNFFRAHALYVGGVLATNQSDHAEATTMLTECLAIRRGLDNPRDVAATLSTLATLHLQQDDAAKAREYQEEAIAVFRSLEDRLGETIGLINLGEIAVRQGDDDGARSLFEQALPIARSIDNLELESECERNLGELALRTNDLPAAQLRFTRSLKICRDAQDKRGEAITRWRLGKADAARGAHEAACKGLADALLALRAFEMNMEALDCLEDYARLLHEVSRSEDAVGVFAAAAAGRKVLMLPRAARRESERQDSIEAARAALGNLAFDAAWSAGAQWTLDEAVARASTATIVTSFSA